MSWKTVELGNLCEILDNRRKPVTKCDRIEGEFPYYGATGIVDYVDNYIFDEKLVLVGEDGAKWESGEKTAFIVNGKYWVNNHAHVIKPKRDLLLDEWLVYYFFYKDLKEFITGLTVPKLNMGQLKIIPIPLPPLPIQQKIVEKLDKIFAETDKATAAIEANVKNAEALFKNYLKKTYKGDKNWKIVTLRDVSKVIAGQSPKGTNYNKEGKGLPFYQGKKDFGDRYINIPTVWTTEITKEAIKEDILISVRAPVGPVNIANEHICIGRGLAAIRTTDKINKEYLFNYFLKIEKELVSNVGAVFNSINKTQIENLKIPLPNLTIQQDIVSKINKISSEVNKLNNLHKNKLSDLVFFKQSILKQAFNGELVKAA